MILRANLAAAVASGRKTTHRLPSCTWKPGRRVAILAIDRESGDPPACYVQVNAIEHITLWALSREQAAAEGFGGVRGPLAFRRYWLEHHDRVWIASHDVVTDEMVAARFASHHEGAPVTVLSWAVCEAPDLFLAQPTRGSGDYTRNPNRAIDPLPVMGPSELDVRRAREEGERQRASFRRDLEAERAARKRIASDGLSNRALRHVNAADDRRAA